MPNHFHLQVRTRTADDARELLGLLTRKLKPYQQDFLDGRTSWRDFVVATFRSATNSHAQYYNKKYARRGQLFIKPTLHGLTDKGAIPGKEYSRTLSAFIGLNYYKHGLAPADASYMWSSITAPKYNIIEPDIDLNYGSEAAYKQFQINYLKQYGARLLNFNEDLFFANLKSRVYFEELKVWRLAEGLEE